MREVRMIPNLKPSQTHKVRRFQDVLRLRHSSEIGLQPLAVWALTPVFSMVPWLAPNRLILKSTRDEARGA
jgi:hypothetical protein